LTVTTSPDAIAFVICFGSNEDNIVLAMLAPIPETESNLKISSDFSINPNKVCASSLFEGG
jgi:hypothetical protein